MFLCIIIFFQLCLTKYRGLVQWLSIVLIFFFQRYLAKSGGIFGCQDCVWTIGTHRIEPRDVIGSSAMHRTSPRDKH